MSGPLSEAYLAEAEAYEAAASRGPWLQGVDGYSVSGPDGGDFSELQVSIDVGDPADAAFIACARTAVPDLLAEVRQLRLQVAVLSFNAAHPVGTPVVAYPGCRPELDPAARRIETRTRTAAWLANGQTPVVMVEDYGSWIALTHVDVTAGGAE